ARERMVRDQIEARGIGDPRVLAAMRAVPRHLFVPGNVARLAYADHPLPIGSGQTISQPYIVAAMTELLEVEPGEKILEIGTGSGYQAAVLAAMGAEVYTIEIVEPLGVEARRRLEDLGYAGVRTRIGDGYRGWPEAAPFDGIIVTAAPDHVPRPLADQLAMGGKMVIPVGSLDQELLVLTRTPEGMRSERALPVRFVPMTGEAGRQPR
ncbi:MAG TPA: protein-L-isoaspartate(D-aspartate) O-methyltransferase, partial [Candidatus Saccharimonadales bacterium]|nr:protein-L-isoaspartate(D-aspartate) O-methyltransferase [Candidatus Saccharimonadales bacterium]